MDLFLFAAVQESELAAFLVIVLVTFVGIFAFFSYFLWRQMKGEDLCPYTGKPLRFATDLSYQSMERVLRMLFDLHDVDNPFIDFTKAVYCRETGRVFTHAIDFWGRISLDWSFIKKRAYGDFVSWGSLTEEQKQGVIDCHDSVEGFQTEFSCPIANPTQVTKEYVYHKPGPLYVDLKTKVLLGWQMVPDTELEILIVQKPTKSGRFRI